MKLKIVHFVFLAFILSFFTGTLSSCFRRGEETPVADLEFFIGDNKFMAKAMNEAVKGDNITVYTRDYKDADGKYLLTIGGAHNDRDVISIKYNRDEESTSYTVITADTSGGSKADTRIPVNGFVVSIPKKSTEGLRFRSNQEVKVSGFEAIAPEYERFDFGTFIPEDKTLTRRVTYINPVAEVYEQSCITLITNDYGRAVELPEGAVAFVMRLVASDNYRITTVMTGGTVDEGSNALIFTGEYNALYAKTFFSEGDKLYISRKDRISSYSDVSAVQINGELYKIGDEKTNLASISESGIYLFNSFFSSLVTPERELDFYDLVVVDDIVVYKGEKNTRIILPSNAGVVVSFVGESVHIAEGLELGDTVTAILMKTRSLPDKYLSVGGFVFEILSVNGIRSEENSCVIYTPEFGTHTGTDSNGTEIVVSAGRIKTVRIAEGNSEIPEDGYVISILRTNSAYKYADNIEAGTDCTVSLADRAYSVLKMNYNNINSVRSTDMLILYKSIPKTGTNTHGYEIIVDSNGKITKENYSGDSLIPDGGLVLSAHGEAEKKLKPAFTIGADVLINEKNKEVTIISTPILKVENAMLAYEQINRQYEQAKAAFYDVNYNSLRNTLDEVVSILNRSEQAMNESDYPTAIGLSATAAEMLDRLSFSMIRSSSIENRAAWYRPTERSEREVRATIEKALSLNINTIYLETWYNGKVIGYSDNSLITHNTSANGDLDALEAFCRIGKENGIEIHAWVENFFIGTLQSAAQNPDDLINKTLGKHLLDKQGNNFNSTIYGDFVFLNPYDRSNRALVMEVYREIIEKYDIDGIHLDYIRFPEPNYQQYDYGYNEDIIKGFQTEYNTSVDPRTLSSGTEMHENWCRFREDIINSWVEEVFDLVMETKPELWISCAAYPDANAVPKTIFQNVRYWVERGWMDEVFSMSYSADNSYVRDNAILFKSITTDQAFYSVGLSAFGTTTEINLALQIDLVRDVGAEGSALFSLGSITDGNYGNTIRSSSYSGKSVQTYLLSKTVSTGLSDILRKLDIVYAYTPEHPLRERTVALINPVLTLANGFDLENASIEQKLNYAERAISDLESIILVISGMEDEIKGRREALVSDFERLCGYLIISRNRLSARLD